MRQSFQSTAEAPLRPPAEAPWDWSSVQLTWRPRGCWMNPWHVPMPV
jgi:hypothetical protein